MKLADGWHRIPGDGDEASPGQRLWYCYPARFYFWACVENGQLIQLLGLDSIDRHPETTFRIRPQADQFKKDLEKIEKFWGKSVQELLEPQVSETGFGKVVAGSLLTLLGLTAVKSFRKRATVSKVQTQLSEAKK